MQDRAGLRGGTPNTQVAAELGVHPDTVSKWRNRFITRRLDGLIDQDRPGRPRRSPWSRSRTWSWPRWSRPQQRHPLVAGLDGQAFGAEQVHDRSDLAQLRAQTAPGRHLQAVDRPAVVDKVVDVVGLYHHPPERAVVLCVDEKSQIQALDRSQPVLPMLPGMPQRCTHDWKRNGITSLFAACNIADGTVIGELHRQHRATEFKQFLTRIDKTVPQELDVHVICDNYGTDKTPAIKGWLARHPRVHLHFTPTGSSWINQVERWFGFLTDQMLRRGSTTVSRRWRRRSARGSLTGTCTHGRSSGPRRPRGSSSPSPDIADEFQAQDTSGGLLRPGH
jgi:transposase-like protein